jgi:hypothetical protein
VAFHGWLLALRIVERQAFEPATAGRWVLALLVIAGFRALGRRGLPIFSGRRAIVLWLLVVIIHVSAAWHGGGAVLANAIPESVTALAQLSIATAAGGVALLAALTAAARPRPGGRPALPVPAFIAGLPSTGLVFRFSPRPPPLA